MKIVTHFVPVAQPSTADPLLALQKEMDVLKEEVAALRQERQQAPIPTPEKAVLPDVGLPTSQDPLFAQLWAYVNKEN